MKDLFGLDSYPECVKELFGEMIRFHENMHNCLNESLRVLSEEKDIKADKRQCLELLKQALEKSRKNLLVIVKDMENNPDLKKALMNSETFKPNDSNPVLKAWANSSSSEEKKGAFASAFFHNCSPEDVSKITINKTITEADGDADLMECMAIFGCDREKAQTINQAISRFDSLLPDKCKKNKIPAIHLFIFMRWCSEGVGYESFLTYFKKHYEEAGGHWEVVGKSALSGASTKSAYNGTQYKRIEKEMHGQLNKMFSHETSPKTA